MSDAKASDAKASEAKVLDGAQQELRKATAAMRRALAEFDDADGDAMAAYARNVRAALSQLEDELDVSGAELSAQLAESREQLGESLHAARSSWAAINDEMKLQAHLAQMEARDLYRRADEDLHQAGAIISTSLEELGQTTTESLDTVRSQANKAIGQLRSAIYGLRLAASRS
jgi:Mg2+ and Co2+ transporter CorA